MIRSSRAKGWLRVGSACACSVALSAGFGSWWRGPRAAFALGGAAYGAAVSAAALAVALPLTLMHLAVGQLCQQDAVGIWRAVPFFKGVGYLRLLISYLASLNTVIYMSFTVTFFFYTINSNFLICNQEIMLMRDNIMKLNEVKDVYNSSLCFNSTFLGTVAEGPEYYLAVGFITVVLWITFPLVLLHNPVKIMKRLFYVFTPLVFVLAIIITANIGDLASLETFQAREDWLNYLEPTIWYSALMQALWSAQVAGGYLVAASDTVYTNANVEWTAITIVGLNIVFGWLGSLFWFSIGGEVEKDTSVLAVLMQTFNVAVEKSLYNVWPMLVFAMLFCSGVLTMLTLVFPMYERCRHAWGGQRRAACAAYSAAGGAGALLALAGRGYVLHLLEDVMIPLLIAVATLLEISVFIFIYGWKILVEDVEFLTGHKLGKFWVLGWCAAPGVVAPLGVWWVADVAAAGPERARGALVAAAVLATIVIVAGAAVAVANQLQYDFISKLKSSFKPSRHWGPRDPITHYYWLARRQQAERGAAGPEPRGRATRARAPPPPAAPATPDGDLTALASLAALSSLAAEPKKRNNSDDWLYTFVRRQYLEHNYRLHFSNNKKQRSKSLDCISRDRKNSDEITKKEIHYNCYI